MTRAPHRPGRSATRSGQRRRGAAGYLAFVILKLTAIPVIAFGTGLSVYIRTSPYPPTEALMHLVARSGCPAAAAVGLAPAHKGELGYHARNDADGDGIACEWSTGPGEAVPGGGQRVGGAKFIRVKTPGG